MSGVIELMEKIFSWYFRSYDARSRDLEISVVSRFSRGNLLVKEGRYLTGDELKAISVRGDEAVHRLEKSN